jgi:hypothetical protein
MRPAVFSAGQRDWRRAVALTGVLSLCSQIVQTPGGHSFRAEGRGGRQSVVAPTVSGGRVGGRSQY